MQELVLNKYNKKLLTIALASAVSINFSYAQEESIFKNKVNDFSINYLNKHRDGKYISLSTNPIIEGSYITIVTGIPFQDEIPTIYGGDLEKIHSYIDDLKLNNPDESSFYNGYDVESNVVSNAPLIWFGESTKYSLLTDEFVAYNSDLNFWHQVAHTAPLDTDYSSLLDRLSSTILEAKRIHKEVLADVFSILALAKQYNMDAEKTFLIANNLKSNRLYHLNESTSDPLHYLTNPAIDSALRAVYLNGDTFNNLSYEQIYNLSTNIAASYMSTDLTKYVNLTMNVVNPAVMKSYISKLAHAQRCPSCNQNHDKDFESGLNPIYLYPEANKLLWNIYKNRDVLNGLSENDFELEIYSMTSNLNNTKGMEDYDGYYFIFDDQVSFDLYNHATENSFSYNTLVRLVLLEMESKIKPVWIERAYYNSFEKLKESINMDNVEKDRFLKLFEFNNEKSH